MWGLEIPETVEFSNSIAGYSGYARQIVEAAKAGFAHILIRGNIKHHDWTALLIRLHESIKVEVNVSPDHSWPPEISHIVTVGGRQLVLAPTLRLMANCETDTKYVWRSQVVASCQVKSSGNAAIEIGLPNEADLIDMRDAEAALHGLVLHTGKASDGWISRKLNRRISQFITRKVLNYSVVSPLYFTLCTALIGLLMYVSLMSANPTAIALGCLLYQLASIVDGVDGEIARVTYQSTSFGAKLDTGVDMATNLAFQIGLFLALHESGQTTYIWVGSLLIGGMLTGISLMTILVRLGPGGGSFDILPAALTERFRSSPKLLRNILSIEPFFKRDFYAFYCCILGVLGQAWLIYWSMLFGVVCWLLAIIICAPIILSDTSGMLRPQHLRPKD